MNVATVKQSTNSERSETYAWFLRRR